jgi:hypothetical protein
MRVFRDKTGLAATPELWSSIERALNDSEFFLLLASPASAQSKWVEQEVDWWLRHRSAAHLLIVCTGGELWWDNAAADFDWDKTTALPRRLEKDFSSEPLFLDLRWARTGTDLSLRNPRFAEEIARLAATLNNRSLDEMIGDDVNQHKRTIRLLRFAIAALIVLTVSALFAAYVAMQARNLAISTDQTRLADARLRTNEFTSRRLAAASMNLLPANAELGILLAAEAMRIHPTREAENALRFSLSGPVAPAFEVPNRHDSENRAMFSPDGTRLLVWGRESARLCDAVTVRTASVSPSVLLWSVNATRISSSPRRPAKPSSSGS